MNNKCVECRNDDDCSGYDPNTHTKLVCDSPSGSYPRKEGSYTYTCKPLPSCSNNQQCEPNWCCDKDPRLPLGCRGSGVCVERGTLKCNKQYLCDPPLGFVNIESTAVSEERKIKSRNLIDLFLDFFSKIFS